MLDSHFATKSSDGSGYVSTLVPVLKSMGNMLVAAIGEREKI